MRRNSHVNSRRKMGRKIGKDFRGFVGIWKPRGPSSYDVIRELKHRVIEKKIGHAGTLDPKASGVIVVAVGREATTRIAEEVAKEKEYRASVRLGAKSSTDDGEGEKTFVSKRHPPLVDIRSALDSLVGITMQHPPAFSALKVKGMAAYARARRGERVELAARPALVKELELIAYRWPYLKFRIVTGPGVYIRAIARDIGEKLRVGGYLASLERTRVGEFTKKNAATLAIRYKTPKRIR